MLKPKKKLTRKRIKEDKLLTTVNQTVDFITRNSKVISIALAVVVLAIVVGYFVIKSKREANIAASGRLILAVNHYNAQQYDAAIPILLQITEQFDGTQNAGIACFYLANSYYYKENYAEAKRYFQIYIDEYGDDKMFFSTALAGLGACYSREGNKLEAARYYEKAAQEYPDLFTAADYLFSAAQNYIAVHHEETAIPILQKIVQEYDKSSKVNEAKLILAELTAKP